MKNILIVDSNHLVVDSLEKKLNSVLSGLNILKATSYKESIGFMLDESVKIDIAIVDLNLPDAKDGAVANFSVKKNIPTIVLTALEDDITKQFIKREHFLDYVKKHDYKGYDVTVSNIVRFLKNSESEVLLICNSTTESTPLMKMLQALQLNITTTTDTQEALAILTKNNKKFSLVLTECDVPFIESMELVVHLREIYGKDELGIIITINTTDSDVIPTRFLKLGANDFLKKPFTSLEVNTRVNSNLETLELFQKTKDLANKDFLTGSYNRRYFFDAGTAIFEKAKRQKKNLAVAMLDIDKFKNINDTYGHHIGDMAIKEVTNVLNNNLRSSDLMARFGGEEFCILLEDISQKNTIKLFEKIRDKFEKNIITIEDFEINFTVSLGISYGLDRLDHMITMADNALYYCKENGRNQISLNLMK